MLVSFESQANSYLAMLFSEQKVSSQKYNYVLYKLASFYLNCPKKITKKPNISKNRKPNFTPWMIVLHIYRDAANLQMGIL